MAMEIMGVMNAPQQVQDPPSGRNSSVVAESSPASVEKSVDLNSAILELTKVGLAFNRRLQFSLNDKINEVVVKVIDGETDKVIKEIPPRELQVVRERIREAIGLLFDERI